MWRRWTKEYLHGLQERHNLKHMRLLCSVEVGNVIIIKDKNKDTQVGTWHCGGTNNQV